MSDLDLLKQYAQGSEEAFATLVNRHLNLVYATALRQVRSPQLAEEVVQSVFLSLASNRNALKPDTILTAWLYRVTRHAAIDLVRQEARRHLREQTALELATMKSDPSDWAHIEPLLDEALDTLEERDRTAVLLRYFENKSLREVGETLGASEDAAQKRVSRAIESLRDCFSKRGVAFSVTTLVAALSAHAAPAAPVGLNAAVSAAITGIGAHPAATFTASKIIAMTSLQKTLVITTLTMALGAALYETIRASRLQHDLDTVRRSQASAADKSQSPTHESDLALARLADLQRENEQLRRDLADLPRLRGEIARLRSASEEVARLKAASNATNDPIELELKSWLGRVNLLKQRLQQIPEANLPEMQLAGEDDWLDATKNRRLDSDTDFRQALGHLRSLVANKISALLRPALRDFMAANQGRFPTDLSQLQPFFDKPVDPAVLQRWEVMPASDVSSLGLGGEWIVALKAPIDPEYDSRHAVGPHGAGSTNFESPEKERNRRAVAQLISELDPAIKAFKAANNGMAPFENPAQLLPYVTTPAERVALDKLIEKTAEELKRQQARTKR